MANETKGSISPAADHAGLAPSSLVAWTQVIYLLHAFSLLTGIIGAATVVGAFHREYRVTVVEDGVATLWPEIQRATLDIIGRAYGRVVTGKEVTDQISSW